LALSSLAACSAAPVAAGAADTAPQGAPAAEDGPLPDDGRPDASPPDASKPYDAGTAGKDASLPVDAAAPEDAAVDAAAPDDPRLDDPSRPSLPFECQGTPLAASEITDAVAQGSDRIALVNDVNWNDTAQVVKMDEYSRTCHPVTGCTAWTYAAPLLDEHDYRLHLFVDATGAVALRQEVWEPGGYAYDVARAVQSGDFQAPLEAMANEGPADRYKVRVTAGCFSIAGIDRKNPPASDGSTFEWFFLGKTAFAGPTPRVMQAPLAAWPYACQGTPSSTATIATWFAPGATRLDFRGGNARRESSQSCHPITGCTPWADDFYPSDVLYGLETTPNGFALRFDGGTVIPIANGIATGTLPSHGALEGIVTTDGCVSYVATKTTSAPGSAVITETRFAEQNRGH
jgi:hypothetical protein